MNILVTGSRGQLGSELQALQPIYGGHRFHFFDLPELDIAIAGQVGEACREHAIDVIVNCAAYTAVDKAEADAETAFRVNRDGAAVLASCAKARNALLVHVSTDYVFNGNASVPYREGDEVSPLGVYGLSKWEGEERIRQIAPSYLIVRTSWLYSAYGSNFVKTMLRLGRERDSLGVVFDQVGTPTWAADLAAAIMAMIRQCDPARVYGETIHYSNEGVCSWYDFARAVMKEKGLCCNVLPIDSDEFPTQARRPHFSVLHKGKARKEWGLDIPHWHDSLLGMLSGCD